MASKARTAPRREESLSRERIIEASIDLLDSGGEAGLTFRALSERLATGAGAIYWHVANKSDLLTAASDAVVAQTMEAHVDAATPEAAIRTLALGMFDAMDAHPWVGTALARAPGQLPMLRLMERLGQQVNAMGVPHHAQWATVSAVLNFILGVGGQNAANSQTGREQKLDRNHVLGSLAATWSALDAEAFPFTRSIAEQFSSHDDKADFLAGVDLILRGMQPQV
ncbi:AcrR family transcriptional regulator [Luteibacter sp. Sphag1AF]|uniref:TetR/AcrR family transcriptional regulator n=1 Tax=Luteibacter sp. Sphag1AF TaxID=2587031 RepID=UPI00160F457A|nr:TetR/AcrR family transcriptional regulator C-terminal domain-containing protein [Luteibacter sp. Sphag1AF]MBB3227935.1 AcrR family transcriptional regulator [Luteibacter sp. Sphag1AF]